MSTEFKVGIDWNRKGMICWDAQAGDALNLFPEPLRYLHLDWRSDLASSITLKDVKSLSGVRVFEVQSGTANNNGLVLGQDTTPTTDDISVNASSEYSLSVRVKGISSYSSVPFRLRVKDQANTLLSESAVFNLGADWSQESISFTTGAASTHIYIEMVKDNDATDVLFQVTGWMLVAGSSMPFGYNTGSTYDLLDNITPFVMKADWSLGFEAAYRDICQRARLTLKLNNSDQRFSPTYTPSDNSNPLAGKVKNLLPVQILSDNGTITRIHWTGWIESISPNANRHGDRTAMIQATDVVTYLRDTDAVLRIQENKRTDEVLETLLRQVRLPVPLQQGFFLDVIGSSELDSNAYLMDDSPERTLQAGQTEVVYAADNWIYKPNQRSSGQTFNVYAAIKDIVSAERGRFYFDREGHGIFWNRHHLLQQVSSTATFDNSMTDMQYQYADDLEFANDVTVICHPRVINEDNNALLWSFDSNIVVRPGQNQQIKAEYKDEDGNRVAGWNPRLVNMALSGNNTEIIFSANANQATLTVINNGTDNAWLTSAEIRGQKITDYGELEATASDGLSKMNHGERKLRLELKSLNDLEDAQTVADFELQRRKDPSGRVVSLTLKSHGFDQAPKTSVIHAQQLGLTIGSRIQVQELQTDHDTEYFIIGERHSLSDNGTLLETTWMLEPADTQEWMVLDSGTLDSGLVAY